MEVTSAHLCCVLSVRSKVLATRGGGGGGGGDYTQA